MDGRASGQVRDGVHSHSWINVIEGFFGKMSRQMLRGIRAVSKKELVERIELYLSEVNADPSPHKWKWGSDPPGDDAQEAT